jgi:predicted unusual protein kinase regulating ubiquinone biosynthesis (AarF/ABC1/UbiB family)
MDYVDGPSLKHWLATSEKVIARVDIWKQYAGAMTHLYDQGILHGDPHSGNVMLEAAPPGYSTERLKGSEVWIDTEYKLRILDTGTSKFWSKRTDFEYKEKRILVEVINSLFGALCLSQKVKMDRSLSLKDIVSLGNTLAVLFARNAAGPPQGSENMEAAMDELDYVMREIPRFIAPALELHPLQWWGPLPRRRRLVW